MPGEPCGDAEVIAPIATSARRVDVYPFSSACRTCAGRRRSGCSISASSTVSPPIAGFFQRNGPLIAHGECGLWRPSIAPRSRSHLHEYRIARREITVAITREFAESRQPRQQGRSTWHRLRRVLNDGPAGGLPPSGR